MEKQLEEFLEKTAQAAGIASMASEHPSASDHTDSDSASHSGCSSHSRSQSRDKESHEKESQGWSVHHCQWCWFLLSFIPFWGLF